MFETGTGSYEEEEGDEHSEQVLYGEHELPIRIQLLLKFDQHQTQC